MIVLDRYLLSLEEIAERVAENKRYFDVEIKRNSDGEVMNIRFKFKDTNGDIQETLIQRQPEPIRWIWITQREVK